MGGLRHVYRGAAQWLVISRPGASRDAHAAPGQSNERCDALCDAAVLEEGGVEIAIKVATERRYPKENKGQEEPVSSS